MTDPGTLAGADRISVWSRAARERLVDTARSYHAVVTYGELADHVQATTDVRTNQLIQHWIGDVLLRITRDCHHRDEPMLSALCVTQGGAVGGGYVGAVETVYGHVPEQPDDHAAEQRLLCHRYFGAELPPDGGRPAVTRQVQAQRDKQRATRQQVRRGVPCPSCGIEMPLSGHCSSCS